MNNLSTKCVRTTAAVIACALLLVSCSRDGREMKPPSADQTETIAVATTVGEVVATPQPMVLSAPWVDGSPISDMFTCAGSKLSPNFDVAGLPAGTVAWGFSILDQTAQNAVHWAAANIAPQILVVEPGVVPTGAVQSLNRVQKVGYAAPCPKVGETHTYILTAYALSQLLEVSDGQDPETMLSALEASSLGIAAITFTVTR